MSFSCSPPCMRRPTGAISFVDFNLLGHVGMSIGSFSCTSTNRLGIQTHTVHSNFSNFKTQTIQIFHMHRGQHPSCFYSKSPSIGIHGNRWVAFSHPCGDIDHWLTLKYECLLSVKRIEMSSDIYWSTSEQSFTCSYSDFPFFLLTIHISCTVASVRASSSSAVGQLPFLKPC